MDNPLIVSVEKARVELEKGLALLKVDQVKALRYRSRFLPGEQFSDVRKYTTVYTPQEIDPRFSPTDEVFISDCSALSRFLKRSLRPFYARKMIGRSIYIEKTPELRFPGYIRKTEDGIYIVDSAVINWTNLTFLTSSLSDLARVRHRPACRLPFSSSSSIARQHVQSFEDDDRFAGDGHDCFPSRFPSRETSGKMLFRRVYA